MIPILRHRGRGAARVALACRQLWLPLNPEQQQPTRNKVIHHLVLDTFLFICCMRWLRTRAALISRWLFIHHYTTPHMHLCETIYFMYILSFCPRLRPRVSWYIIPREPYNFSKIKSNPCAIPDYNLSLYQVLSRSVQPFKRERVTNIHPSSHTFAFIILVGYRYRKTRQVIMMIIRRRMRRLGKQNASMFTHGGEPLAT